MTLSAHKIYGPKGVGALVLDKRIELKPLISGGGHEQGLRSGTENVAGIVGFGAACELAVQRMNELAPRLIALRDQLERGLRECGAELFGAAAPRIPNTSYFSVPGIEGETLVIELDRAGFADASGAACSSTSTEPSATLLAMGVAPELARGAVRFSLGNASQALHVEEFLNVLSATVARLRRLTAIAV
jgi:cysteine desulfurase